MTNKKIKPTLTTTSYKIPAKSQRWPAWPWNSSDTKHPPTSTTLNNLENTPDTNMTTNIDAENDILPDSNTNEEEQSLPENNIPEDNSPVREEELTLDTNVRETLEEQSPPLPTGRGVPIF